MLLNPGAKMVHAIILGSYPLPLGRNINVILEQIYLINQKRVLTHWEVQIVHAWAFRHPEMLHQLRQTEALPNFQVILKCSIVHVQLYQA